MARPCPKGLALRFSENGTACQAGEGHCAGTTEGREADCWRLGRRDFVEAPGGRPLHLRLQPELGACVECSMLPSFANCRRSSGVCAKTAARLPDSPCKHGHSFIFVLSRHINH